MPFSETTSGSGWLSRDQARPVRAGAPRRGEACQPPASQPMDQPWTLRNYALPTAIKVLTGCASPKLARKSAIPRSSAVCQDLPRRGVHHGCAMPSRHRLRRQEHLRLVAMCGRHLRYDRRLQVHGPPLRGGKQGLYRVHRRRAMQGRHGLRCQQHLRVRPVAALLTGELVPLANRFTRGRARGEFRSACGVTAAEPLAILLASGTSN